jgi:nucleoside-diphosphate-sugar epimerase
MRILITGGSGCVGYYLVQTLLAAGHDLVLVVRSLQKLPPEVRNHPAVQIVAADMRDLAAIRPAMAGVQAAVLVATAWGGPDAEAVIRDANLALTDALIAAGCGHVAYFATASVLGQDGALLPQAANLGTEYIRAKYGLVQAMETRTTATTRITGLFPTLVFGGIPGSAFAPLSHFARLLLQVRSYLWLVRFLSAEAKLHMIHAADIATVTRAVLEASGQGVGRVILGNPATSADDLVRDACRHFGKRRMPVLPLRRGMAEALIKLFRIQLSPWDRYCMEHPDQSYPLAVNPAAYGLPVVMPDLGAGFATLGVAAKR